MATIGGHDENCDVFQLAPDGGPSQKPCNCRHILGAPECTGIAASWCPIHGDCTCDKYESGERKTEVFAEPTDCPLHSRESTHALGASTG